MDQFLLAAATALISAMATDGWKEARAGAVALWRRVHPDRVPGIESELEDVRNELLAARHEGDAETEKELVSEWGGKLRRLTSDHPELMAELRRLLQEEWGRLLPAADSARVQSIQQTAVATGGGKVNQVGRDQFIIGT